MRNFWIEVQIDGRATPLRGGPISKDGGFSITVYMKQKGESVEAMTVTGQVTRDGDLLIKASSDIGDNSAIVVWGEH